MIVFLNDYVACSKSQLMYLPADEAYLAELWKVEQAADLERLQELPSIKGYTSWRDLTPNHYRLIITHVLNLFANLNDTQRSDRKNPVTVTLHRVIYFFMLRLEDLTTSTIEHFRINRYTTHDVTYDYSATFDVNYAYPQARNEAVVEDSDTMRLIFPEDDA